MVSSVWVIFKFVIVMMGLFSAWQMGKHTERPKARWPKGGIMQGGWKAWEPIHYAFIALLTLVAVFQDALNDGQGGGLLGGVFQRYGGGY